MRYITHGTRRFISPAVVAPETVDINLPNESLRRGLMIIAKIIQNLANNVQFGKEPHMMRLNDYLATNMQTVTGFFSMILVWSVRRRFRFRIHALLPERAFRRR